MRWPFVSRRERVRREASDWIARLNGPHGEQERAEFERWYRSSADHAAAYDRISALFEAAGRARRPEVGVRWARRDGRHPRLRLRYAVAAAVSVTLLALLLLSARSASPARQASVQFVAVSAPAGATRRIVLLDGSEVFLSPGASLDIALASDARRLRLLTGEGRFSVAREARPFIVAANATEVVARGTRFVVRVVGGVTSVSLIEGRVDVSYPSPPAQGEGRRVARLKPGERLVVQSGAQSGEASPVTQTNDGRVSRAPAAMLEFDETPLGDAVKQMNGEGEARILLDDSALAALRVTGAYRAGDTSGFAASVAAAFGLELDKSRDGKLLLRRRTQVPE